MFEVNDKVVYGIVGVCEVEDIAAPPIKGIVRKAGRPDRYGR